MTRWRLGSLSLLTLAAMLITGCGSATPTPRPTETPEPPAFDVGHVISNFRDECLDPAVVDAEFCEEVDIDAMTAEGDILYVPTNLDPDAEDRGSAVCDQLITAHFDSEGTDLGYEFVGILANDRSNLAACSVT